MQAWRQWRNETPLEILDTNLRDSFSHSEVIKCIQIGLLCVQENPEDRPSMTKVVSYLSSLSAEVPLPGEPAFSTDMGMKLNMIDGSSSGQSTNNSTISSINDLSKSTFFPR